MRNLKVKWHHDYSNIVLLYGRMRSVLILICICATAVQQGKAQIAYHFSYNKTCKDAYKLVYALKNAEAQKLILQEMRSNQSNMMPVLLANTVDFFELFFNEDPAFYKKAMPTIDYRVQLINNVKNSDQYKHYALGVIDFQRAIVYAKFNHEILAMRALARAREYFKTSRKNNPSFYDADMYLGTINCMLGTIPDGYKWLANLLGFGGNINTGKQQLANVASHINAHNEMEYLVLNTFVHEYVLNKHDQAWAGLMRYQQQVTQNRLIAFLIANLSLNNNKSETAAAVLDKNMQQSGFMNMPMLHYERGCAALYALDAPVAIEHLNKYVKNYKGNFYIKDAYYKLSILHYLQQQMPEANLMRKKIAEFGHTKAEADQVAQTFSTQTTWPHKELLSARLLCDGGYYTKTLQQLTAIDVSALTGDDKIEYFYRYARMYDLSGNAQKALEYYQQCIALGKNSKTYFAARSYIQSALIYEQQNNKKQAIAFYKACLALGSHQYKNSLDQKAKAGLARLGAE